MESCGELGRRRHFSVNIKLHFGPMEFPKTFEQFWILEMWLSNDVLLTALIMCNKSSSLHAHILEDTHDFHQRYRKVCTSTSFLIRHQLSSCLFIRSICMNLLDDRPGIRLALYIDTTAWNGSSLSRFSHHVLVISPIDL